MPRTSSARTNTTTSTKTAETIAEARKALAEAHEQGRHRKAVPNCPTCEKAAKGNGGNGNGGSKTTTTKATSTSRKPRGVTFPPFREVSVLTETYMEVQGQDGQTFDLVSCPRCAALLPSTGKATDPAEKAHRAFHEQIDGLDQRSA